MVSSFQFDTINLGWSTVYVKRLQAVIVTVFLSLNMVFVLENSWDPGEMPHHAHTIFYPLPKGRLQIVLALRISLSALPSICLSVN